MGRFRIKKVLKKMTNPIAMIKAPLEISKKAISAVGKNALLSQIAAGGASFFGGPLAGMAVKGLTGAMQSKAAAKQELFPNAPVGIEDVGAPVGGESAAVSAPALARKRVSFFSLLFGRR